MDQISNSRENLATVIRGAGQHVVGALAMWSLSNVRIERAALRSAFEAMGLGEAVPRDPSFGAVLNRACQSAKKGNGNIVFDKVVDDHEKVVYALSDKSTHSAVAQVSYQQRVRVAVNKSTGSVLLEDEDDATLQRVAALFSEERDFAGTDDLSAVLSNCMNGRTHDVLLNAVNLRGDAGGVYFVPAEKLSTLQRLQEFVNEQGQSQFTVWEITGSHQHLAQAARAATHAFSARLDTLRREVQAFSDKVRAEAGSEDEATQAALDAGINLRREKYEQLAAQVETYADVLGAKRDELLSAIGEARAALRAAILGVDA